MNKLKNLWRKYFMSKLLKDVAFYVKDKIDSKICDSNNYISTDNMLVDKQGITISNGVPKNMKVVSFKKGDILISNIRPYFKKIWLATFAGGCSSDVLVVRPFDISCEYLFTVLSQDCFFDYVMKAVSGSKMPRGEKEHIMRYPIFSVSNPQSVGDFIVKLNEIINLNLRKVKENNMILNYFYQYLIFQQQLDNIKVKKDLNYTQEWSIIKLKDLFNIAGGYAFNSFDYLKNGKYKIITIKNVNDEFVDEYNCDFVDTIPFDLKENQKLNIGDILISLTGKTGRISIVNKVDELMNQRVGKIDCNDLYKPFVYCLLKSNDMQIKIQNISTGGNQKNLSSNELLELECKIPKSRMKYFNEICGPILNEIILLGQEIELYKEMRETYASLLLSNQIKFFE